VATSCEHVHQVRDDWGAVSEPVCEDCARTGGTWVSLRRCLSCGHVGCCDSSPNRHATAHHEATSHPMVRALIPNQDWAWCYVDEVALRHAGGDWDEVDLFLEAGLGFMREHLGAGGDADLPEDFTSPKGFPLGGWLAEMRRRRAAGELSAGQEAALGDVIRG
jgi:Zn-finger in ubiquitin-hydrolases and other protein